MRFPYNNTYHLLHYQRWCKDLLANSKNSKILNPEILNSFSYFCANLTSTPANVRKIIFGTHKAQNGSIPPVEADAVKTFPI